MELWGTLNLPGSLILALCGSVPACSERCPALCFFNSSSWNSVDQPLDKLDKLNSCIYLLLFFRICTYTEIQNLIFFLQGVVQDGFFHVSKRVDIEVIIAQYIYVLLEPYFSLGNVLQGQSETLEQTVLQGESGVHILDKVASKLQANLNKFKIHIVRGVEETSVVGAWFVSHSSRSSYKISRLRFVCEA